MALDNTDLQILNYIQQDSTLTNKELAAKVHLTPTPVHERLKRLEREGYIKKYVALLDPKKLDKTLVAFCSVSLKEHAKPIRKEFEREVSLLPMVTECYNVTGNVDYLLKIVVRNMEEYQDFVVNKLAALANIGNTNTAIIITEVKLTTEVPLFYATARVRFCVKFQTNIYFVSLQFKTALSQFQKSVSFRGCALSLFVVVLKGCAIFEKYIG